MFPHFDLFVETADTLSKQPGDLRGLLLDFATDCLVSLCLSPLESSLLGDHGELLELVHDDAEPVLDLPPNPVRYECRSVGSVALAQYQPSGGLGASVPSALLDVRERRLRSPRLDLTNTTWRADRATWRSVPA